MRRTLYITLALVLLLAGCKKKEEEATESVAQQEERIADVDTVALYKQTFQKQLLCNGRLSAIRRADLQCPKAGEILQSVHIQNGQWVSQGAVLAVADTRDKTAELEKAKHDLEKARVELQDKLIGLGYDGTLSNVPADVLQRAEITSGYYSSKYQLEAAQKALADCQLRAPFSGRIANLEARAHQVGGKFATLLDDSFFDVEFKILEAELPFMHNGQVVKITPFVREEESYDGTVTECNPTVDEKGLVILKARIKNTSKSLMDGMNVRVTVEDAVPGMFVVPKDAVIERDGYHVVFLYDAERKRAVWTYVDILYSNLTQYAITGCEKKETELHEGDIVITSGNLNLADDTEVRINKP
jgi:RND family efflux transporter MFP subunit